MHGPFAPVCVAPQQALKVRQWWAAWKKGRAVRWVRRGIRRGIRDMRIHEILENAISRLKPQNKEEGSEEDEKD
eukprot:8893330-Pyramimonas_sp.AAC.1